MSNLISYECKSALFMYHILYTEALPYALHKCKQTIWESVNIRNESGDGIFKRSIVSLQSPPPGNTAPAFPKPQPRPAVCQRAPGAAPPCPPSARTTATSASCPSCTTTSARTCRASPCQRRSTSPSTCYSGSVRSWSTRSCWTRPAIQRTPTRGWWGDVKPCPYQWGAGRESVFYLCVFSVFDELLWHI